jgi:hypothetical protein
MSAGSDEITDLATARGRDYPSIRQFSIFSPNKVGQLLGIVRQIESAGLRICALSVSDAADYAVIRLVVTHPERAFEILERAGYKFCEVDLLVVEMTKQTQPMLRICTALLQAEINIHYCFPFLAQPHGRPVMAFYVDGHETAARVLEKEGFTVLSEHDLEA